MYVGNEKPKIKSKKIPWLLNNDNQRISYNFGKINLFPVAVMKG